MNKQVIIAGALGAAAAWTCDQPFVTRSDKIVTDTKLKWDNAKQATLDATADIADAAKGALPAETLRLALIAQGAHTDSMADYHAELKTAQDAKLARDGEAAAAKKSAAAQDVLSAAALKLLTGPSANDGLTKAAADAHDLVTAQIARNLNLSNAVTELGLEIATLTALSVTADATKATQSAVVATALAAKNHMIASKDTNWQGSSVTATLADLGKVDTACYSRRVPVNDLTPGSDADSVIGPKLLSGGYALEWWNSTGTPAACAEVDKPKGLAALKAALETTKGLAAVAAADAIQGSGTVEAPETAAVIEVVATGQEKTHDDAVAEWDTRQTAMQTAYLAYDTALRLKAMYVAGCSPTSPLDVPKCSGSGSTAVHANIYDMRAKWQVYEDKLKIDTAGENLRQKNIKAQQALADQTIVRAAAQVALQVSVTQIANWADAIAKITTAAEQVNTVGGVSTVFDKHATEVSEETRLDTLARNAEQAEKTAESQKTAADARLARGVAYLAVLVTDRETADDAAAVQEYLKKDALDKKAGFLAAEKIAEDLKDNLTKAVTFAEETVRDAAKNKKWVDDRVVAAQAAVLIWKSAEAAAQGRELAAEGAYDTAVKNAARALAACKGQGYDLAQAARKEADEKDAALAALVADTKAAYDTKAVRGTLCAFPVVAKDADAEPRAGGKDGVNCGGDEKLCCGAAQKFLKDGTKLSIETCQTSVDTHTYKYWPALPVGAIVEPKPETWRWQCISGAQKLVAAATATLAASYMMA